MKRQDGREVPHESLLDDFELSTDDGERSQFGGQIKHGELRHALRLFKDRSSGVVRIEASALRGPMKDVPLWTAFLTRYAKDPDHIELQAGGVVHFAALRPPPYVFLAGYEPPKNRLGEYILQFTTTDGMTA